jgi:hypothetical protein
MTRYVTMMLTVAAVLAHDAAAQGITQRVTAVRQGTVELHFAARDGVCGDGGERISIGRSTQLGRADNVDGYSSRCEPGPVRVRLRVENGTVTDIRTAVGPARASSSEPTTDLGAVSGGAAVAYFLELAKTANAHVSNNAVIPAILADSAYPWRELLAIARDTATRSRGTRSNASLWLSRFASSKLAGHENDLAAPREEAASDESQARTSAVFALSQLRNHEGIAPLLEVARTNKDERVREQALFWLGQSGDPRALGLFEEVLRGR